MLFVHLLPRLESPTHYPLSLRIISTKPLHMYAYEYLESAYVYLMPHDAWVSLQTQLIPPLIWY